MARPRIFVSSTFYDLRHVRADLEEFVSALGYEPVLHERGSVPYGKIENLEEYCYREIDTCDIVVSIIGNRFGNLSAREQGYSISQVELKTAHKLKKQIYVFVEKAVETEYNFYLKNKANAGVVYTSVDDVKIFEFLEEVKALSINNVIQAFENVSDIKHFLREQWAGLFQRLLLDQDRLREASLVADLSSSIKTLSDLINIVQSTNKQQKTSFEQVLLINHPVFEALKRAAIVPYRVFFINRDEMKVWFEARGFRLEEDFMSEPEYDEWYRSDQIKGAGRRITTIKTYKSLFNEDGSLRYLLPGSWDEKFVVREQAMVDNKKKQAVDDDDIPF